jgi:hypothetical protein
MEERLQDVVGEGAGQQDGEEHRREDAEPPLPDGHGDAETEPHHTAAPNDAQGPHDEVERADAMRHDPRADKAIDIEHVFSGVRLQPDVTGEADPYGLLFWRRSSARAPRRMFPSA